MPAILSAHDLNLWYGAHQALHNISIDIPEKSITALIGPSGCGKSTFLKTLNRMNDLVGGVKITGEVTYEGENIYDPSVDVNELRKSIGMVFQKPNPFPMSIYDNIAYGRERTASATKQSSMTSWKNPCAARPSGTRSKTGSRKTRSASPAASSRGSASRGRLPSSRRCF